MEEREIGAGLIRSLKEGKEKTENKITEEDFLKLKLEIKQIGLVYIDAYEELSKVKFSGSEFNKTASILNVYGESIKNKRADLTALLEKIYPTKSHEV